MMLRTALSMAGGGGRGAHLSTLILHGVTAQPDAMFPENMHARQFDAMLGWLTQWFNVMPLGEAVSRLSQGTLPARALAITFDDGYADNHDVALPILQKHGLSACFFVTTGFLNGGRMWNDSVIEAIRRTPLGDVDLGELGRHAVPDMAARRAAVMQIIPRIKHLEPAARQAAVEDIVARCEAPLPDDLMMRDEQVRALRRAGMEIGAHTCTHPILAKLDEDSARREIAEGRAALEGIIGERVALFAYPNGRPREDYTSAHVRMVRELGFDAAVSTAWGASRHGDDMFQLRRFMPWDTSRLRFGLRMLRNLAQPRAWPLVQA